VKPLLDAIGQGILDVGDEARSGSAMKLVSGSDMHTWRYMRWHTQQFAFFGSLLTLLPLHTFEACVHALSLLLRSGINHETLSRLPWNAGW